MTVSLGALAQAVDGCPQDRLDVARGGVDARDGMDQIEDLIDLEVVAYLLGARRGHEEGPARVGDPSPAATKSGVLAVSVLEQLGGNLAFASAAIVMVMTVDDDREALGA